MVRIFRSLFLLLSNAAVLPERGMKMSRRVLNQKGFSLIETVIAMAIIIIVTVSALTMVTSSLNITKKEIYTSKAQYFAADSLEAFRIAEDAAQFEETIAFAGGYSYFDVDENIYIYIILKTAGTRRRSRLRIPI